MAAETVDMPQGTAPRLPTHPSAPPLRFSSPSASIPSLEQPLSGEIRGEQPTFGEVHGKQPVSGVIREEQGGKDLQQKKIRKMPQDAGVDLLRLSRASSASVEGVKKGPTSPAGGGSLRAIMLALTVIVALVVPIFLLVYFHGRPMSQVWILSLSICSDVFLFLLFIWRSHWYFTYFIRLSYCPLLALFCATVIDSATATFVLLFSMAWAAGTLGYSLAVHRLRKGTEPAIDMVPSPSCSTEDSDHYLSLSLYVALPFVVISWAFFMALVNYLLPIPNELDILMCLSYIGWIHVAVWLMIVTLGPMKGFPIQKQIEWSFPGIFPCVLFGPATCFLSQILSTLCHLLFMLAMVAFLWYNLAIYIHFLATATPSITTRGSEDTLHGKVLEDKMGLVKSNPRLRRNAK